MQQPGAKYKAPHQRARMLMAQAGIPLTQQDSLVSSTNIPRSAASARITEASTAGNAITGSSQAFLQRAAAHANSKAAADAAASSQAAAHGKYSLDTVADSAIASLTSKSHKMPIHSPSSASSLQSKAKARAKLLTSRKASAPSSISADCTANLPTVDAVTHRNHTESKAVASARSTGQVQGLSSAIGPVSGTSHEQALSSVDAWRGNETATAGCFISPKAVDPHSVNVQSSSELAGAHSIGKMDQADPATKVVSILTADPAAAVSASTTLMSLECEQETPSGRRHSQRAPRGGSKGSL